MSINEKIVQVAVSFIGQTEISGNKGFKDKDFENRMRDVGWDTGLAWCSFFAEMCWVNAYAQNDEVKKRLAQLFSGSATTTYKNFDLNKIFKTSTDTPVVGAVAIYRHGNGWQGHAAIVEKILDNATQNIEGNTNAAGGREGIEVARKVRPIKAEYKPNGLNLVGFIHPL